jgi:hypothetical protein
LSYGAAFKCLNDICSEAILKLFQEIVNQEELLVSNTGSKSLLQHAEDGLYALCDASWNNAKAAK